MRMRESFRALAMRCCAATVRRSAANNKSLSAARSWISSSMMWVAFRMKSAPSSPLLRDAFEPRKHRNKTPAVQKRILVLAEHRRSWRMW